MLLFGVKIWDAPITVNVYILLPSILLTSDSSAFTWRTQQAPWSLWPVFFIRSGLFRLSASAVPSHSSDMPGPLTPLLANELASDFPEKVGLTDWAVPIPHHKLHTYQTLRHLLHSFFIKEDVSSLLSKRYLSVHEQTVSRKLAL